MAPSQRRYLTLWAIVAKGQSVGYVRVSTVDQSTDRLIADVARQLEARDPSTILRGWARSDDRFLQDFAQKTLDKLEYYAQQGEWQPRRQP